MQKNKKNKILLHYIKELENRSHKNYVAWESLLVFRKLVENFSNPAETVPDCWKLIGNFYANSLPYSV